MKLRPEIWPQASVPTALVMAATSDRELMALALYAYLQGAYGQFMAGIFPSLERVAGELSVSVRTLQRARQWLESRGWMTTTVRRDGSGRQTSNAYELHEFPERRPYHRGEVARRQAAALTPEPVDNADGNGREYPVAHRLRRGPRATHASPYPVTQVSPNPYISKNELRATRTRPVENTGPAPPTQLASQISAAIEGRLAADGGPTNRIRELRAALVKPCTSQLTLSLEEP